MGTVTGGRFVLLRSFGRIAAGVALIASLACRTSPAPPSPETRGNGYYYGGSVYSGRDGLPFVVAFAGRTISSIHCHDLGCARTTTRVLLNDVDLGGQIAASVDGSAPPIIVVSERQNARAATLVRCNDDRCSSHTTTRVAIDGTLAGIARREGNLVLFVTRTPPPRTLKEWYELYDRGRIDNTRPDTSADVYELRCQGSDCSRAAPTLFAQGTSSRGFLLSNRSRLWLVEHYSRQSLRVRICDPACSQPVIVPYLAGRLSYAAISGEQSLLVAAVSERADESSYDIAVTLCDASSCGPRTYLETGILANGVAVATSNEGLPRLAYQDATSNEAYLVQCSDTSCGRFVRRRLGVVSLLAMTVGADGRTLLLQEGGGDKLVMTRCLTDDCARTSRARLRVPGLRLVPVD